MKKLEFRSHCPINFALDIFGDKWSLLIIRDLLFKNKNYYGDFLQADEAISTNILADRLVKLEHHGLISKSIDETKRSKLKYSLTSKGKDLLPMLLEMIAWSGKYDKHTEANKDFIKQIHKDRKNLMHRILSELES